MTSYELFSRIGLEGTVGKGEPPRLPFGALPVLRWIRVERSGKGETGKGLGPDDEFLQRPLLRKASSSTTGHRTWSSSYSTSTLTVST